MSESATQPEEQRRRAFLRGKTWIKYPFAEALLLRLKGLLDVPHCHRMPGLLIIGETNCGKTMTVSRFERLHSRRRNVTILFGESPSTIPVVYVQTPPSADEGRFYNAILSAIGAPSLSQTKQLHNHTMGVLRIVGCRMLIIDEVHNLLLSGGQKLRQAQAVLRYLSNELQIPIVTVGIKDALNVFVNDPQLANRFQPVAFPRWQMDEAFLALLKSFESRFPDWEGMLTSAPIASGILAMSEGILGEIIDLTLALRRHVDRTGQVLTVEALEACGYAAPSLPFRISAF